MDSVVIGADPHKLSVTIQVVNKHERVLHQGRYGTDTDGYRQMLTAAKRFEHRRWAVEGCIGIGRQVAQGLVADGETVVDVPAKLAARARVPYGRDDPPVPVTRWYSMQEVADMLGYGLSKVKMLVITRELRSVKDGKYRRILPEWVDEYVARRIEESHP